MINVNALCAATSVPELGSILLCAESMSNSRDRDDHEILDRLISNLPGQLGLGAPFLVGCRPCCLVTALRALSRFVRCYDVHRLGLENHECRQGRERECPGLVSAPTVAVACTDPEGR